MGNPIANDFKIVPKLLAISRCRVPVAIVGHFLCAAFMSGAKRVGSTGWSPARAAASHLATARVHDAIGLPRAFGDDQEIRR